MKKVTLIILAIAALGLTSCAKRKKKNSAAPVAPLEEVFPPGGGPGVWAGPDWKYGAKVAFNTSDDVLTTYSGHSVRNVRNAELNINLIRYGQGFGGSVAIRYDYDGFGGEVHADGLFTSLIQREGHPNALVEENSENNQYNVWFTKSNRKVWHGFFEEQLGARPNGAFVERPEVAVIVVIDDVIDLGDGGGTEDVVSGRVYYKLLGFTHAPAAPTSCWFITAGVNDCRAWKSGDGVRTTQAVNPDSGYRELGSFSNLSLEEAFNGELEL